MSCTLQCCLGRGVTVLRGCERLRPLECAGAAIASIFGTCFSRIAMGSFCDAFGPRLGHIAILSLTSTAGVATAAAQHHAAPPSRPGLLSGAPERLGTAMAVIHSYGSKTQRL